MTAQPLTERAQLLAMVDGFPVFPCRADKRPACDHGFKDATDNPDEIARLFAKPGAELIGMPTGAASGIDVLDIDPRHGGDRWFRENEHLIPPTRRHHTRSGGFHILFRHSPGLRCSADDRLAPGVDVRADGGYVIRWDAEGLFADGPQPAPWPDWLLTALLRRQHSRAPGAVAIDPAELAPPSAAVLVDVLNAMPNPADTSRQDYVALNLAVQGCIRGLEALDRCDAAEVEDIRDAAASWSARWESDRASSHEDESALWETDWSTRDNDLSGWRHVLDLAERVGMDVSGHRWAAAAADFPPLPDEPAAVAASGQPAARRPVIPVRQDNLTAQIDMAEAALLTSGVGLYQRAGELVRVGEVTERTRDGGHRTVFRTVRVTEAHLRELIGRVADFVRYDARARDDLPTKCPPDLAVAYLARQGLEWRVPHLAGVVTAPTLRPDGSLLQAPGYDTASGLLFDPRGVAFPPIAEAPTRADALAGLELLRALLAEFPFIDDADRAVALSAILTALVRRSMPAAPMHGFTAPAPGTGKSYLVDIVARIATGAPAPGLPYVESDEENRKAIESALIAGLPLIVFDNVAVDMGDARLNQLLTQETLTTRVLGESRLLELPCGALVLANGNNLTVAADMARRTVLCRLDAATERPEARTFRHDPAALISADRGRYVAAALTILRAYVVAGRPGQPSPLGSFEAWSDLVRGALIWTGEADPVATMDAVRAADPQRADLVAVMEAWAAALGDRAATVAEVIAAANVHGDLRDALVAVAGVGGAVNSRRLGNWLRLHGGRIVNGTKLCQGGRRVGMRTWQIEGLPPASRTGVFDLAAERARRAQAETEGLADLR